MRHASPSPALIRSMWELPRLPITSGPLERADGQNGSAPPHSDSTLLLVVELDDSDPRIWRKIEARGGLTLGQVHELIQAAFGWNGMGQHRFTARDPYEHTILADEEVGWPLTWVPAAQIHESDDRSEEEATLAELLTAGRGCAFYEYDFDAARVHRIELVGTAEPSGSPALLTSGAGCPVTGRFDFQRSTTAVQTVASSWSPSA